MLRIFENQILEFMNYGKPQHNQVAVLYTLSSGAYMWMTRGICVHVERKLRDLQSEGIIARLQINCEKTKTFRINAKSDKNSE